VSVMIGMDMGDEWFEELFLPFFSPVTVLALLCTLVSKSRSDFLHGDLSRLK
jgi:cytochrome c biogenesis factor